MFSDMDLKSGSGIVTCDDKDSKAECTITISDSDMVAIATGKMNAQNVVEIKLNLFFIKLFCIVKKFLYLRTTYMCTTFFSILKYLFNFSNTFF